MNNKEEENDCPDKSGREKLPLYSICRDTQGEFRSREGNRTICT